MAAKSILSRFESLNVWKRAPHKPLLMLYALGRWARGEADTPFAEAVPDLTSLLIGFGPRRKSNRPGYPFWRLQ